MTEHPVPPAKPPWRSVALPTEHGSWGLVLEPIALGLLVAPGPAGALVGLAALCGFLAYRPAKLARGDRRRGRRYARTALAERFALGFAGVGLAAGITSLWLAGPWLLAPVALAAPLAALYVAYDLRPGRWLQAELTAPAAFSVVAACIAVGDGWALPAACALWVAMVARGIPAVLYVRSRLALERGLPPQAWLALAAHAVALASAVVLAWTGYLPTLSASAFLILLLRASYGLSPLRHRATARQVGIAELVWGGVTVLLLAAGYWGR